MRGLSTGLCLAAMVLPASVSGQSVLFDGPNDSNNCIPFGCLSSGGRYQQIYAGGHFSTSVFISAITLFADETDQSGFRSADYTLRLSTTSAAVGGLSTILNNNLGADLTTVFMASLSGTVVDSYSFLLSTPFFFDPSQGNLLLEVLVQNATGDFGGWFDAYFGGSQRVYNTGSGTRTDALGLVTEFSTAPVAVVPEPITMVLLGSGLLGVGAAARRRRRNAELQNT